MDSRDLYLGYLLRAIFSIRFKRIINGKWRCNAYLGKEWLHISTIWANVEVFHYSNYIKTLHLTKYLKWFLWSNHLKILCLRNSRSLWNCSFLVSWIYWNIAYMAACLFPYKRYIQRGRLLFNQLFMLRCCFSTKVPLLSIWDSIVVFSVISNCF